MSLDPLRPKILMVSFLVSILFLSAGCLSDDDKEAKNGVSAVSVRIIAEREIDHQTGDLELVVVTGLEPASNGRSNSWKFAYNNVTSGIPLGSYLITIGEDGSTTTTEDDPLQKTPIRNWSLDSTTAYSKAHEKLIEEGIITRSTKISVQFIYLLGEDNDNNGCEWTIGLLLGSDQQLEVIVRVDGSSGDILQTINSKN